jgi:Ethanolamine utilization protein EutJ (predicted chaperonin)
MKRPIGLALVAAAGLAVGCAGHEKTIALTDMPGPARAGLERAAAGGQITSVEKTTKNGQVVYSADATINGKAYDITVDESGKLISKELEEENEKGEKNEKD